MTADSAVLPVSRAPVEYLEPDETEIDATTRSADEPVPVIVRALLGALIIPGTLAVSIDAGWLSFHGVKQYLGDWQWPASLDGAIVVATLLRMFALTFRWRLPGATLFIWAGLGVTVAMNVESLGPKAPTAMRWAHGAEPLIYLFFVESLAWLLKMQLRLRHQSEARLTAMSWLVSPVVTCRAWLLMQRTGKHDPMKARAAIQRAIRAKSQLLIICPSPVWQPIGGNARRARSAALQSIRDGLLDAAQVVELLQENRDRERTEDPARRARKRTDRMDPIDLLSAVNRRALQIEEEQQGNRRRRRPTSAPLRRDPPPIPTQRVAQAAEDREDREEQEGEEVRQAAGSGGQELEFPQEQEVPNGSEGDEQEDEDDDRERQKKADALTIYLAYQAAGRRMTGPRLGELASYSRTHAYRLIDGFRETHGAITATDSSDDTTFAENLMRQIGEGFRLNSKPEAAEWRLEQEREPVGV